MSVGGCHQLARTGASSRVDPIMTSSGRGPCSRSAGSLSRLTLCLRPCRSPAVFVIFRSPSSSTASARGSAAFLKPLRDRRRARRAQSAIRSSQRIRQNTSEERA
jgi:hypothetical protein